MPRNKLKEYMKSSGGSSARLAPERLREHTDIKPRSKRLLREALTFLENAERGKNPEGALRALFALYEEMDPYADYIRPGEREFFPSDRGQRTLERFLEGFRYVYYILKRAQERLYLGRVFSNFWERCTDYLAKCGYSEKYICSAFSKESLFYRQSFQYWRQEFKDSEEGFSVMYEYWKACFGIEGNEEYCMVKFSRNISFDWRRMKLCREKLVADETRTAPDFNPPVYEEWSNKSRRLIRSHIEKFKREKAERTAGADAILAEIKRRNHERWLFVNGHGQ